MSFPHIKRKTAFNLSYESRYAKPLIRTGMGILTGSRARSDSKETHVSCHKRAKHASQFSRVPIPCYNSFDGKSNADQDYEADSDFQTMAPGIRALRAKAIEFLFVHIYKSPPKTEWRQLNLLPTIMRTLKIANGSFGRVTEMLEGILDARANGTEFKQRLDGRGRKPLIIDNDYCAKIVYHAMASGQSIQSSAYMVNVVRESRGEQPVSWSALHRFVSNSDIIQTHRRQTKKSGKDDENSIWSRARAAQFLQVLSQLAKGEGRAIAGVDLAGLDAMYLRGIVWWDEKHK